MDEIIEREVLQQWSDFLDAQIAHCEDGIFGNAENYSIVYDIEWSIEGNKAVPIVKLNRYDNKEQNHCLDILSRHGWLPRGAR
jgi:hypothetical protein